MVLFEIMAYMHANEYLLPLTVVARLLLRNSDSVSSTLMLWRLSTKARRSHWPGLVAMGTLATFSSSFSPARLMLRQLGQGHVRK